MAREHYGAGVEPYRQAVVEAAQSLVEPPTDASAEAADVVDEPPPGQADEAPGEFEPGEFDTDE